MPDTWATSSCRRLQIWAEVSERALKSLSTMRKRPLFRVVLVPSMPTYEVSETTSGSSRIASAIAACRCAIAVYDTELSATLMAWITPTSCTGNRPFGMTMYRITVRITVTVATIKVRT